MALADVIFFQVVLTLAFPIYLVWLWYYFNEFAWTIISATLIGYCVVDLLVFATAAMTSLAHPFRLLPYLPLYTLMQLTIMRVIRLIAIVQELMLHSSYRDPYVPARVMRQRQLENN